jgi:hypothetical protein
MPFVCVELRVTINYINTSNVAQQYFYIKLMSLATMPIIRNSFERNYIPTNLYCFHTLHIKAAALKKRMFVCPWPSLEVQFG